MESLKININSKKKHNDENLMVSSPQRVESSLLHNLMNHIFKLNEMHRKQNPLSDCEYTGFHETPESERVGMVAKSSSHEAVHTDVPHDRAVWSRVRIIPFHASENSFGDPQSSFRVLPFYRALPLCSFTMPAFFPTGYWIIPSREARFEYPRERIRLDPMIVPRVCENEEKALYENEKSE
jgi:hypothetical protein